MSFGLPNKEYDRLSGDCTEDQQPHEAPRDFSLWWLFIYHNSRNSKVHSHPERKVVPYITTLCISEIRIIFYHFDKPIWYCSHAAKFLTHLFPFEFFLDLWVRSLWGPLLRAQRLPVRLRRFVWISPSLWFCDHSEIKSKSSWFWCLCPRRLFASNLGRYKAIYLLFAIKLS